MIIYQATKKRFVEDVQTNRIDKVILEFFKQRTGQGTSKAEIASWRNSMLYMSNLLWGNEIPDDSGVAIEFRIPQTSKRVDFILTGQNENKVDQAIIVELKQWSEAERTEKDAIVKTFLGGAKREVSHPSYQAWSYAALLEGFNEAVYKGDILLAPCAYLHNCDESKDLNHKFYAEYLEKAPLFLRDDVDRLRKFISQHIKYGDKNEIIYRIDKGRIRPSKNLADSLSSLMKGNPEFIMIDDQKVVLETALALARKKKKKVLIVEGGPGTGKSVVAINLLVRLTNEEMNARYVTKNAAPRAVYENKLTGTIKKSKFSNLFSGSGGFVGTDKNAFDALIVDEAHRLNEKSGLYANLGENQVKEIINAAQFSVFFIDEDQRVTLSDIGTKEEIRKWADKKGADVYETELSSQFRCNGSDGYLAWLDMVLQVRETANDTLEGIDYEFRMYDNPNELRDAIEEKNRLTNKARIVAGYCWDWNSKKTPRAYDVVIPEHKFFMKWNLTKDGSLWMISPDSVSECGCIHTCQGLEVDYVGVIIGPDLVVRNGQVITDAYKRSGGDKSIRGYKSMMKKDPIETTATLRRIILNTYRTLMTRGAKGCFLYCTDPETGRYFRDTLVARNNSPIMHH